MCTVNEVLKSHAGEVLALNRHTDEIRTGKEEALMLGSDPLALMMKSLFDLIYAAVVNQCEAT